MAGLSQKAIRAIVQEAGTITKGDLVDALGAQDIDFNAPLLDGFIVQATTKGWLEENDGSFNIKRRVGGGGGTPTALYKVKNHLNPLKAEMTETKFDAAKEEADPLLKRTKNAALKVAKAAWYNEVYKPQLAAYMELEEEIQPGTVEEAA